MTDTTMLCVWRCFTPGNEGLCTASSSLCRLKLDVHDSASMLLADVQLMHNLLLTALLCNLMTFVVGGCPTPEPEPSCTKPHLYVQPTLRNLASQARA
jgi:hypothetical protein